MFMKKHIQKKVLRRLKILEGQVRGLQGMVEKEEYCIGILNQASAVKEALSGIEDLIMENHLSTHVIVQIKKGDKVRSIKEILAIYKLSKKR